MTEKLTWMVTDIIEELMNLDFGVVMVDTILHRGRCLRR